MRHPHGRIAVVEDGRTMVERDVAVCAHCQRVVEVDPGPRVNIGWCGQCGAPVCPACEAAGRCVPFEQQLARAEARDRLWRAVGGAG